MRATVEGQWVGDESQKSGWHCKSGVCLVTELGRLVPHSARHQR